VNAIERGAAAMPREHPTRAQLDAFLRNRERRCTVANRKAARDELAALERARLAALLVPARREGALAKAYVCQKHPDFHVSANGLGCLACAAEQRVRNEAERQHETRGHASQS
jgi:hypothetical protein